MKAKPAYGKTIQMFQTMNPVNA